MYVYLLHYLDNLSHAQHYLGITNNPRQRFYQHACGQGAEITKELQRQGIDWVVALLARTTLATARKVERALKNGHNLPKYCPICSPEPAYIAGVETFPLDEIGFPLSGSEYRKHAKIEGIAKESPMIATGYEIIDAREEGEIDEVDRIQKQVKKEIKFATKEALTEHMEKRHLILGRDIRTGKIVGYAYYTTNALQRLISIHHTAVEDAYRRQGIGAALVAYVRARYPTFATSAKVREDLPANEFWPTIGFELIRRQRHKTSRAGMNCFIAPPTIRKK